MNDYFVSELDGSPELGEKLHTHYQELIVKLRRATELGQVDVLHEVIILSQFQANPREAHLEQLFTHSSLHQE